MRLRGAISGEELGTVTVKSFDQLHDHCGRGARFLDGAREIATQDELDAQGDVVELQVVIDVEAAARAATVEALLECDPLDVASLARFAVAAGKLDAGFWDRKPEVLRVVRKHGALFGWAGPNGRCGETPTWRSLPCARTRRAASAGNAASLAEP